MTERAKEERDVAAKLFEEILEKYEEISKQMVESGELTTNDLGIISTIIDNAREATNEAKTQTEVTEAQTEFKTLLETSSYNNLVEKVDDATKLQKAQQDANATLSAYKEALDGMTESEIDSYDRAIIESEIKEAQEAIEKAKKDTEVTEIMTGFEKILNTGKYQKVREAANDKLIATALDKAIAELEVYTAEKYASYIIESASEGVEAVTVKSKAEDYIKAIRKIASGIETVDKSQIVGQIESNLKNAKDFLNSKITSIEADIKENYDQYLTSYDKAIKELDEYATDANAQLTGKALEDIISLINDTKAKIANDVDTVEGVNKAMSLFRKTVETYAPEFAKAEATKAQTNAIAELEKYENSTNTNVSNIAKTALIAIRNGKSENGTDMTANEITETLNTALQKINNEIEIEELEKLKEEKIAELSEYLNYEEIEDSTGKIKPEIAQFASQAIEKVQSSTTKKAVNDAVEDCLDEIDKVLKENGKSLQQRIEKARQEALAKIAEYEELATKTNEISLISAIIPYENKINSANATVQSINDTLATVTEMIKANYAYINDKIEAIDEINSLTLSEKNGYEDIFANKDVKEVKDAIAAAIENIKNAQEPTKIETVKTTNINEIKKIAASVAEMENARNTAIKAIQESDTTDKTTGELDDKKANGSAAGLVNKYINDVKAVTLAQYNKYEEEDGDEDEDTNIFDDIVKKAQEDIEIFINNMIEAEAEQLSTSTEPETLQEGLGKLTTDPEDSELKINNLQEKITTTVENGHGTVSGTLKYAQFKGFSEETTEQEGYYLCLKIENTYANKITISAERVEPNLVAAASIPTGVQFDEETGVAVIRIPDNCINEGKIENLKITVKLYKDKEDVAETATVIYDDFGELELNADDSIKKAIENAVKGNDIETNIGEKRASDIQENVTIEENTIQATLKKVKDANWKNVIGVNEEKEGEASEYYLCLKIENKYAGDIKVTKSYKQEDGTMKTCEPVSVDKKDNTMIIVIPKDCIETTDDADTFKAESLGIKIDYYGVNGKDIVGTTTFNNFEFTLNKN